MKRVCTRRSWWRQIPLLFDQVEPASKRSNIPTWRNGRLWVLVENGTVVAASQGEGRDFEACGPPEEYFWHRHNDAF
jgi:hypothetical protein